VRFTFLKQVSLLLLVAGAAVAGAQVRATSTTLQLGATSGNATTAQVHVSGASNPTGIVTVFSVSSTESRELGSVALDANGDGTVDLPANATSGQLSAVYKGDSSNGESTSSVVPQKSAASCTSNPPTPPPNGFCFTPASATALTVKAGSTGTFVGTVTPDISFTQNVSFYCTGLPQNAQCVFTPSTVQTATGTPGTSVNTTLQILTTAPSGSSLNSLLTRSRTWSLAGSLALGIGLLLSRRRSKALSLWLRAAGMAAVGAFLVLGLSGCNARYNYLNHPPSPRNGGTPLGTYNISVTASSDNGITATTNAVSVALTVD